MTVRERLIPETYHVWAAYEPKFCQVALSELVTTSKWMDCRAE
jgi:hypothetical protein